MAVDPADPSTRVNLSELEDEETYPEGEVEEMFMGPTGRYVLFWQHNNVSGRAAPTYFLADLAASGEPVVEFLLTEGRRGTAGFDPKGRYLSIFKTEEQERPGVSYGELGGSPAEMEMVRHVEQKATADPPVFSEDGQWMYFSARDVENDNESIYRISLSDGIGSPELVFNPERLDDTSLSRWRYLPGPDKLVVAVDDEPREFHLLEAEAGAEMTQITDSPEDSTRDVEEFSVSPDGSMLAVQSMLLESFSDDHGVVEVQFFDPSDPSSELGSVELSRGTVGFRQHERWIRDSSEYLVAVAPQEVGEVPEDVTAKLWSIDTETMEKTELTDTLPPRLEYDGDNTAAMRYRDPMWRFGPDGQFYFRAADGNTREPGLYRGSGPRADDFERVVDSPNSTIGWFAFSSDGQQLFYKTDPDHRGGFNLVVAPIDAPTDATLLSEKSGGSDEFVGEAYAIEAP